MCLAHALKDSDASSPHAQGLLRGGKRWSKKVDARRRSRQLDEFRLLFVWLNTPLYFAGGGDGDDDDGGGG